MKPKHLILTLLALLTSITASAEEWTDDNGTVWNFSRSGSNATIANRGYSSGIYIPSISGTIPNDLTIPATVYIGETPYTVTSIGEWAFNGSGLTSINIPEGVTSIGERAFSGCSSLTSINIPDGVTSIGTWAFSGCSSLTSITIPEGVTSIGNYAFYYCSGLTSITIPEGVTSIGNYAFYYCSGLTSINIPEGVTSIGSYAFSDCSRLTSINIPESVTSIGGTAFSNCSSLTSVHIGSSSMPQYTYKTEWTHATLFVPDEAVDVYQTAWPDHATQIVPESSSTYLYDVAVTALADASAVIQEIGEENALKVVNLKVTGSINSYDVMVFRNKMLNLRNLDLSDATIVASDYTYYNNQFKTKDNVVTGFFAPSTLLSLTLPNNIVALEACAIPNCQYLTSISIPESVTSIGSEAFSGCSRLQSATLPSGITKIPDYAFYNCKKLSSIELPRGVTSIGDYAFGYCNSLTAIDLPKGLKTIGNSAFTYCYSITQIKLPPYVESMGGNAFEACTRLNDITVYIPDYTLSVNEGAFASYTTAELKIPRFLYNDYYYNEGGWKRFINIVRCDLQPGDYETLPTNTDTSISGNDEIIPKIDEDTPIDGEIFDEGSITVTDDVTDTQEFDNVDQNIDGEGHGGSLIGENDGEDGNLSVNQLRVNIHVKPGRWYFFIFPYDVTIENVEYPGQYAWLYYDAAHRALTGQTGWKTVEGETLQALHGYAFQSGKQGTMVVTFNKPNFGGDPLLNLVAHAAENIQHASWNLVGNPHSSFYEFLEDAFSAPITRWNPSTGNYTAYRPGDDDIHLQPYEAFFVQKPGNMDHIKFKDVCRESYRKSEEKKVNHIAARRAKGIAPQRRLINLEILSGEEQMDQTRVVLNNEKSHAYELDCDAAKMMSGEAKAQLYSVENGVQMAINERPLDGDIRLGYTAKTAGTLSISAQRMDLPMMLIDTQLGVTFDLSLGTYDFETAAGTFDGRFLLRPSGEATAINSLTAKTGVAIGTQDGGIAIGGAEGKTVSVYNVSGAQVAAHDGNGFIALKSGVYVVSVDGESAKVSVK